MIEVDYLKYIIRAVPVKTGWQVQIFKPGATAKASASYNSSAIYSTRTNAIDAGIQFIQRQQMVSVLWQFLYECYCSAMLTDIELDNLSASLCLMCSFKDSRSDSGYWYR